MMSFWKTCSCTCGARFGRRSTMSTSAFACVLVLFWAEHGSSKAFVANAVYDRLDGIVQMESNKTGQTNSTTATDVVATDFSDHLENNLECEDYAKHFHGTICQKGMFSQLGVYQNKELTLRCKSAWEDYCRDERQRVADEEHKEPVNHPVHDDYTMSPGHRKIQSVVVEMSSSGYTAAVAGGVTSLLILLIAAVIVATYRRKWRLETAKGMDLSGEWPYRWFCSSRKQWRVVFHRRKPISSIASDSVNTIPETICDPYAGARRIMEKNVFMGGKEVVRIEDGKKRLVEYRYSRSFPVIKKRGDQEKLVFEHLERSNVTLLHIVRRVFPNEAVYQLDLHLYVEFWELGSVASFARSTEDKPGQTVSLETGLRLIHHLLMAMSEFHGTVPGNRRVHMDVKADNVFLRNIEGELVLGLADFDHAVLEYQFKESETTDFELGQCRYRAPELLRIGKHVVRNSVISFLALQKSDIYSTALVMWEILEMCVFQESLGRPTVMNWGLAYEDRFEHLMKKDKLLPLIAPVVVDQGCRPGIIAVWVDHEVVAKVVELMKWMWAASWEDRPDARSALASFEQILNEGHSSAIAGTDL